MDVEKKLQQLRKIETYLEQESMLLSESNIDTRLKLKKLLKEKIRVLFICHRPEVWNSLKTVYKAFHDDPAFETLIIAIPNKKQLPEGGLNHEVYESEGAEDYWESYDCVCGYNYENGQWIDPRDLCPDYVFFQQPYNITRSAKYKSWIVSKYAKLCYVAYAYPIGSKEIFDSSYPSDFLLSTSLYFAQDQLHYHDIQERLDVVNDTLTRAYITGFPRFDLIQPEERKKEKEEFCALWTPRWSTRENNSFFFEYKDLLLTYCDKYKDFSLLFRPHPQAFLEWNATGEMTESEACDYKMEYEKRKNAQIDANRDYLLTFERPDCLIADMTSLMAEYFLTGKPIIYCHRENCFTEAGKRLAEGFYWVQTWEELRQTLNMLRTGQDPLREKRTEIMNTLFFRPEEGAGYKIKEIIKKDALK